MYSKENNKWKTKQLLEAYPIGETKNLTLSDEYAKISVVSFIISRDLRRPYEQVLTALCQLRGFTSLDRIPDLIKAQQHLKLRPYFIEDMGKVRFLQENNPCMYELAYLINKYIELHMVL